MIEAMFLGIIQGIIISLVYLAYRSVYRYLSKPATRPEPVVQPMPAVPQPVRQTYEASSTWGRYN